MSTRSRRRRRRWLIAIALVALVVAAAALAASRSTPTPRSSTQYPTAGATPTTDGRLGVSTYSSNPTGGPSAGGVLGGAQSGFGTGLSGNGFGSAGTSHKVVLHAWSTAPIPALGWWVPTAKAVGRLLGKTSDWTQTFTAYGPPKYAQLYLATDYRGIKVHCSITVDGVVTASRTSNGPYGDIMCVG